MRVHKINPPNGPAVWPAIVNNVVAYCRNIDIYECLVSLLHITNSGHINRNSDLEKLFMDVLLFLIN